VILSRAGLPCLSAERVAPLGSGVVMPKGISTPSNVLTFNVHLAQRFARILERHSVERQEDADSADAFIKIRDRQRTHWRLK
jgi:hypothetical protein